MKVKAEIEQLDQCIDARLTSILTRLEKLAGQGQLPGLGEDVMELRALSQLRSFKKSLESKLQNYTALPKESTPQPAIEKTRLEPQKE
jgi:hypothetical protein